MSVAARALHGVNTCLLPNDANDNRPLVLRHKPLSAISAALILIKGLAILTTILTPTPAQLATITSSRVVQLTNQERVKAGLAPLTINSALTAAAQDKGNDMLEHDYFAHISPSGVTPWFWIQKHGYDYSVAGENLAIDFTNVEDVVAAWMASPSHRENILRPDYTETGVAVVTGEFQGGTSTIVVHDFGKPAVAESTTVAATPTPTPAPQTAGAQTSATPTPTPTPTPSPTQPRAPRIAVIGSTTVQNSVELAVTASPNSSLTVLADGTTLTTKELANESSAITLDISSLKDGDITLQAYINGTISSPLSNSLTITKDTTGPSVASQDLIFAINPLFDIAQAAVTIPAADQERVILLDTASPQSVAIKDSLGNKTVISDITLTPILHETVDQSTLDAPNRMNQLSRRITATTLVILLVLLLLSILIRIRIQHPALIAHASFVILLAGVLFFV